MSRIFAITAASTNVALDAQRGGEAHFTVSNQSGQPVRGRAHLVAEDSAAEEWLTVRGQAEREFAADGTERYTIDIDVPPGAPSGSHTVRLDMVGVDRPDEQYVEGPAVTFQVPGEKPKPKAIPTWVPLVVAGMVLLGALLVFWCQIFGCDQRVTGTVTDAASGEPLAGATVAIAETDVREETNADGEYAIDVRDPEDALVFTSSGYLESQIAVSDRDIVNIELTKAEHAAEQATGQWLDAILARDVPTLVGLSGLPFMVENEILISESEVRSVYQTIVEDVPEGLVIDSMISEALTHFMDEGFIEADDDLLSRMELSDDDLMVAAFINGELIGFPFRRHPETIELVGFRPLQVPPTDEPAIEEEVPTEDLPDEEAVPIPDVHPEVDDEPIDTVFTNVEEDPVLIGGLQGLHREIRYPESARRAGIEGRVFVQFIVDQEGNVAEAEVTRSPHPWLNEEALRVIRQAQFEPGQQRGRPVRVRMSLPITFSL